MLVDNKHFRTIWEKNNGDIEIIDQTVLPHKFETIVINSSDQAANVISNMNVRGAPLIGATGAYGICLGIRESSNDDYIRKTYNKLLNTRPTAVNLRWGLDLICKKVLAVSPSHRLEIAYKVAREICENDIKICEKIGENGLKIIKEIHNKNPEKPVNILTHCNAGWLATIDWGTATAPIYKAQKENIPIHIWVDETRPRNQGANLTSYELKNQNVDHTVIVDNAGGHLMQNNLVDICIVGTDRTSSSGDVTNKIGTYLKALAANDNNIPFYVALPSTTIDWTIKDGLKETPIEERDPDEVNFIQGLDSSNNIQNIRLTPKGVKSSNFSFDTTPGRLVTGLITERGTIKPNYESLKKAFE